MESVYYPLLILAASIAFIIFMTAKLKMNAFFVLIVAGVLAGLFSGLLPAQIIETLKIGFGNTLGSIGIVIVAGTTLGLVLEKTGAAISMADFILKKVGKKNSALAMSLTGLIFGIPIFCDSGFVILSPLNKSISIRSGTSIAVMAVSLGTSLLAIHCFIPPHPGATAAGGIIGVDIGQLMLMGLVIAVPTALVGYIWANTYGKRFDHFSQNNRLEETKELKDTYLPNPFISFIPVLLPIVLIALKSILLLIINPLDKNFFQKTVAFIGDPSIALLIGLAFSFFLVKKWKPEILDTWLGEGIKNAGSILAITAAGGAFGAILKETDIGFTIGNSIAPLGLGIFLPFIISAILKTAQGSSTVAIITAASLVVPLLPELQLNSGLGPILTVLALGAGSMVASHTNDSYFWVVTKFSDLKLEVSLKVFTTATIVMGTTAQFIIFIFSLFVM